jgi:hypothetical protein
MNTMIGFRVVDTGLNLKVRDLRGRFASGNQASKRANQRSVEWLGEYASQYLATRVVRDVDTRTKRTLEEVVRDPAASRVGIDGFDFLVDANVRRLAARVERYYRVIEGRPGNPIGSSYWVGRRLRMAWSGGNDAPFQAGRFSRKGETVLFKRPIPAYHYVERARNQFERRDIWRGFMAQELRMKMTR